MMFIRSISLTAFVFLLAWAPAGLALDGPIVQDMRKEFAKGCREEVAKTRPQGNNKTTNLYCDCYGQEMATGINESDLGAMLQGRETAHLTSVSEASARFCQEKYLIPAAQAEVKTAKYEDLPDLGNPDFVRTKSGVFAIRASGKVAVAMDSEQLYMLNFGEYFCGWQTTPVGKQSSQEIIKGIKTGATSLAQSMLRSPDAQVTRFEETNVRGRPAAFMELRGAKAEDRVMTYSAVVDAGNRAVIGGVCITSVSEYEKNKDRIRTLGTAALAARRYKD